MVSWNDTPTKQAIVDFVSEVTDQNNTNHVPPEERVAVFDNDGTLWCERPLYAQFAFVFDLLAEKACQSG